MAKEDKPVIQVSRKGVIVGIGLLFFVSAWMFILGLLVGRGTAPVAVTIEKWKTELSERKARMLRESEHSTGSQTMDENSPKPDLGFYEELKKTSPRKKYSVDMPPAEPKKTPTEAVAQPKPRDPPAVASKPQPEPKPRSAAEPAEARPADGATNRFTVQVAALKEAKGAQRMVDELRSKGYPAYQVRSVSANQAAWFRVRVGAFKDRTDAEKVLQKLKKIKINGLIVSSH